MSEKHQFQLRRKSFPSSSYKGKTILVPPKKTDFLNILEEGKDVTPKPLNPESYTAGRERQISVYEVTADRSERVDASGSLTLNIFKSQSTVRFRTDLDKQHLDHSTQYKGSLSYGSSYFDAFLVDISSERTSSSSESLPSFEDENELDMKKVPTHISLLLSETNTFFLLDIPSSTAIKDSDEGNIVEEQNEQYEFLTEGKGRNRKVVHAEVQTVPILKKTRNTDALKIKTISDSAFASNWDMYDTYQEIVEDVIEDSDVSEEAEFDHNKLDDVSSVESYRTSADEKQLSKLIKNPRFLEALCVIERLLANNCYNEQQKIFRGLSDPSDFRENIEYNYKLNLLWTFANSDTKGHSVNAMHWNPANKDILAVGYGKFFFADSLPGKVLIWNIKNPVQPERQYDFKETVTALNFSKKNPSLLAVGFYNGSIVILNVISREKIIIGENMPTFEPVWHISWFEEKGENKNEEKICATYDDGKVCVFQIERKLMGQQIMHTNKSDGKLKGFDTIRECTNVNVSVSRYVAALDLTRHPSNPFMYFIATNQGVVHKCSTNYLNQHLDMFLAHYGPISSLKFSPFSNKIFATCGADWHSRFWTEGISEPLLDLFINMQTVQGLDWSPTHSTIFVTIRSQFIQIWDFQRKAYEPQTILKSPTGSRNTVVHFTESGRCLVVGDIDGNVHIYALEDMPFPAFFQENLLFESLYRALITNQELLKKLKKLRRQAHGEKFACNE